MEKKLLLLHICCAPCGAGCMEHPFLEQNHISIARLFFSNSNLDSKEEFDRRLFYVQQLGEIYNIPVEVDPYDHERWHNAVHGYESCPEGGARCPRCFAYSLARTAARAGELGFHFATTLTVSPRKSSKVIFETASVYDNFIPLDFKKQNGYLNGTRRARELDFYRQNYCGCEFSLSPQDKSEITPPPSNTPSAS